MNSYPTFAHFVGAWLHQDWDLEYATVWDALDEFVAEEPANVDALRREVRALLDAGLSEEALDELLGEQLGCAYWPAGDGLTFTAWLQEVDRRLSGAGGTERR